MENNSKNKRKQELLWNFIKIDDDIGLRDKNKDKEISGYWFIQKNIFDESNFNHEDIG